jgi:hypothetical protein
MAMFSRRRLWRALINRAHDQKLKDWVSRLNSESEDYVANEWELILLDVFSQFGSVEYEAERYGRPDILFQCASPDISFVADVATVSDRSLHKKNPSASFSNELRRRVRKEGIDCGSFFFEIGERAESLTGGRGHKRSLLLPHVSEFPAIIFNEAWSRFLRDIRTRPAEHHLFRVSKPQLVDVTVGYQPSQSRTFTGLHASYTGANVLTKNVLFSSLREKARKLKNIRHGGLLGVIICDGGCNLLTERSDWSTYKVDEIVTDFFRQHSFINFVMIIGVKTSQGSILNRSFASEYLPKLFVNGHPNDSVIKLQEIVNSVVKELPRIHTTPANVAEVIKWKDHQEVYVGGWEWSASTSRISSRELVALLAGKLSPARFADNHQLGNGNNAFLVRLASGQVMVGASLEYRRDEDDDGILLEFDSAFSDRHRIIRMCSEDEIRLPSRELLLFLAGMIKREELMRSVSPADNFAEFWCSGRMIERASYQSDDSRGWICLKFGSRDPAVAPFWVPNQLSSTLE